MRSLLILWTCALVAWIFTPSVSCLGSTDFYLYQDTDLDGLFDNRIHFKGDLEKELQRFQPTSPVGAADTCWQHVLINILRINCYNDPPCPSGYVCRHTGSFDISFIFSASPCSCFSLSGERQKQRYLFMPTGRDNMYKRIPISGEKLDELLFSKFEIVEEEKGQRCDQSFGVEYTIGCWEDWFCPFGECQNNPDAHTTDIIAWEPLCECYVDCAVPALSHWGLVCLVVLLGAAAVSMTLRRRKAAIL